MFLAVDAQPLQDPDTRNRGIGRQLINLLEELAGVRAGWRIQAVLNGAMPPATATLPASISPTTFEPLLPMSEETRDANEGYFGDWLCGLGADAILETNFFEGRSLVPCFSGHRPAFAGVVHDLIPLLFHRHYLASPDRLAHYASRLRRFAQVDVALSVSRATQRDVERILRWPPGRVVPILGAADTRVTAAGLPTPDPASVLVELRIDRPFVLYVGGVDRRKNLIGAMATFAALPPHVRDAHLLVIVCELSSDQTAALIADARSLGIEGQLRLTGFVRDEVLRLLYATCRVSVFPSFYEGLGLPILESLVNGAPVVASDRSAMPEFSGAVSRLADPSRPAAMAAAILETLAEPYEAGVQARRTFAEGFTWEATARATADAIQNAATTRKRVEQRTRRPRVAWVSPMPPVRSGIADYSAELIHRMDGFDIELVVGNQSVESSVARAFRVLRPEQVPARHADDPFDAFVYHVGNSGHHVYMLDLLFQHRGLVVLHDLHLAGLAFHANRVGKWPGDLADDLEGEGAASLAAAFRRGEANHQAIAAETTLNRRILRSSESVVVHNAWSWSAVRAYSAVPVLRIPHGMHAGTAPVTRASLALAEDAFAIVTLGEVTAFKRIDRLIEAVSRLPERIRARATLTIVGDATDAMRGMLMSQAAGAGIGRQVTFTGRVPLERLPAYGRAADVCVQLRYPHRGETSGALLRALAAGGACVVSDNGGFAELPGAVALRVRTPDHEVEDLTAALTALHDDNRLAMSLRQAAAEFVAREHSMESAARGYVAAIQLTIDRRQRGDGEWLDAAAAALAQAGRAGNVGPAAIDRWAALRAQASRAAK